MSKKKGSVVIEGAISFSIALILITTVVNVIVTYRTDILLKRALTKTCNEFSLLTPLSVTTTDVISTLINAAPDVDGIDPESSFNEVISTLIGFDMATGNSLTDGVLTATLASTFENDIKKEYKEFNNGSSFMCPENIEIVFNVDATRSVILVEMTYSLDTISGTVVRRMVSGIPFYGDMELFLRGKAQSSSNDSIWDYDNFTRGAAFIEMYGGNLPSTFPVINGWDGSTATSITSINTFGSSYSDMENFDKRVVKDIDELAQFDGANVNIAGNIYTVDGKQIENKVLVVVVPENCDDTYLSELDSMTSYARRQNVDLVIEQYGIV